MTNHELECENCHTVFTPAHHRKLRWGVAAAGFIVGGAVTGSVFSGLLIGGLSYAGAALYDDYHARLCPNCHQRVGRLQRAARDVTPARAEPQAAPTTH